MMNWHCTGHGGPEMGKLEHKHETKKAKKPSEI